MSIYIVLLEKILLIISSNVNNNLLTNKLGTLNEQCISIILLYKNIN